MKRKKNIYIYIKLLLIEFNLLIYKYIKISLISTSLNIN